MLFRLFRLSERVRKVDFFAAGTEFVVHIAHSKYQHLPVTVMTSLVITVIVCDLITSRWQLQ